MYNLYKYTYTSIVRMLCLLLSSAMICYVVFLCYVILSYDFYKDNKEFELLY